MGGPKGDQFYNGARASSLELPLLFGLNINAYKLYILDKIFDSMTV